MHNRKKPDRDATEIEKQALKDKSQLYQSLVSIIWEKRRQHEHSPETLALLSKLSVSNPDFYSLWNFRREILLTLIPGLSDVDSSNNVNNNNNAEGKREKIDQPEARERELDVTAAAIRKNPKSYGAWHHRLWIVDRFQTDYQAELALCKEFLRADQRNFHCWNYRRAIFQRSGLTVQHELDFCLAKIEENFSNYSAFHHRSYYIKQVGLSVEEIFQQEWPLVENAIFTEPDDQSAWWYYQFLVTLAVSSIPQDKSQGYIEWMINTLKQQLEAMEGLLEIEPDSRWPLMIKVFLADTLLGANIKDQLPSDLRHGLLEQRLTSLERLCEIDPIHVRRYRYQLDQVF